MVKRKNKNIKNKVFKKVTMTGIVLASALVSSIPLLVSPLKAEAVESIYVSQNDSSKIMIESSQLRVWMLGNARYGIQLKSNGATIFYASDSAYINIITGGSFTSGFVGNFHTMTLKSFVVNGTTIEQTRTDGVFDYIFRLNIVNATTQGAYMKAELEMKNLTGSYQNVGASFNIDTMVNGNDASPFRIIPNGWEAFNNGVQVTAYYKDVFNVTNADAIYLGHYSQQYPMPIGNFYPGQPDIYPGDSGAGFYYNLETVAPYQSRKESWIMGMGPRNANPTFTMTAPADYQTFYRGQTLPISGTARDTDIGDRLDVKWAIDGGAENNLTSFIANGSNQSFNYNYTLPSNLAEGWHTLQVWVMDDKGGVSSSNTKQFYVNNFIAPGTPTFSSVTNNSFAVSFDKRGNVSSTTYELYNVLTGQTINMGASNSINQTGLNPNKLYQYKVRAKNTSGVYTAYSAESSIYTLANQPTAGSLNPSTNGQLGIDWGVNGNPSGTNYRYEVRKTSDNSVVKSGNTTGNSVNVIDLPTNVHYKVYVKAINGNNVSTAETYLGEVFQDTLNPLITFSKSTSDWTNENVTITATATDSGTGVKRIQLPNGNWVNGATASYSVGVNGTYSFLAEDQVGNRITQTISITNIDKQVPTATHVVEHIDSDNYRVTITAEDDASGIKQIKLPNGSVVSASQTTFSVKKGEIYQFEIEDKAGNKLPYEVKVDIPELTVYQKDNHVKAEWVISMLDHEKSQLFRGNTKIYEGLLSDYEDKEATDKTKPNGVTNVDVQAKQGEIFMGFQKPEDIGTDYEYTVKAISNRGDSFASEKKKATVTSGLDGYSYVVDTTATTNPDNTVDTKVENIKIPITNNGKYYIHIKSIDKAGNASDVSHIPFQDNVAPTMTLTQNPTGWTSSPVQITVDAVDQGLGMKRIKLPNGTWIDGDNAMYTVTQNGTYTFIAEDLVGNQTTKSITISNIDTTAPTAPTITNNQDWTRITPVAVSIRPGTDSQSGVKHVEYKLEGATIKGWTTYANPLQISNEGETKVIARTIDNLGQPSIEVYSFVRIDLSPPHNTGITIELKP